MKHLTTEVEIPHSQQWSRRRAGVLLHPTSLPGPGRCGVLGDHARRFVDLIASAGFTVWQVLPIGPVDDSLSLYLPRNHKEHAVVYTGTHDNDTTVGWYQTLDDPTRNRIPQALGDAVDVPAALLGAAVRITS